MKQDVSIVVPTYNGGEIFKKSLDAISKQDFCGDVDLIIIDSGSTDGSQTFAEKAGARVFCIDNKNFHHSKTRNEALQYARFENVVFTVQDAIPTSRNWLSQLCDSLEDESVASISVGQIPHEDSDLTARFEVEYHGEYLGESPSVKSIASPEIFEKLPYDEALHTVRHDNVCSIYRRSLLQRFPFPVVDFAEDMAWAHHVMLRGYKVGYDPRIKVRHSHNRSPEYRFKRYIVNSIACAKILGRIKDDLSYITLADILYLAGRFDQFAISLKKEWHKDSELSSEEIKTLSLLTHIERTCELDASSLDMTGGDGRCQELAAFYENHIRSFLSLVSNRYDVTSFDDYSYCVEQVAASTLGVICGELYSSHLIKGDIPQNIEQLILPFTEGV